MQRLTTKSVSEIASVITAGGLAVIPTDTLYGIVALADDEVAVAKLYKARRRDLLKPCIVLVASVEQMWDGISREAYKKNGHLLPSGAVSVIIPIGDETPLWVKRAGATVAYRIPKDGWLIELLNMTGPLLAPSANLHGQPPAINVADAEHYFADAVSVYVDDGDKRDVQPSRLVYVDENGNVEFLR